MDLPVLGSCFKAGHLLRDSSFNILQVRSAKDDNTQKKVNSIHTNITIYQHIRTYRFMPRRSKSGSRKGSNLPTNVPEVSGRSGEVRQLGVVAEVELLQSGARPDLVRQPAQVVRRQRDLLNRCEKGTHTYIHSGQGAR